MPACRSDATKARCTCTYEPCPRKGVCCECLRYHWNARELPACLFPAAAERTYDRSLAHFLRIHGPGR